MLAAGFERFWRRTQRIPGITQAQRTRLLLQAGARDARHLPRHIRPQAEQAWTERIGKAQHMVAGRFTLTGEDGFRIFGEWRNHRLVAVIHEAAQEAAQQAKLSGSKRRQHIHQAGGKQFGIGHYITTF